MATVAQDPNQYVFATTDAELEEQLREAIVASTDDLAFRIQILEVLLFWDFTFALELERAEIAAQGSSVPSSSSSNEGDDYFQHDNQLLLDNKPAEQVYSSGENSKGKEINYGLESRECSYKISDSVHVELCGICFEDSPQDMHEGLHCLHRYCHSCMTHFIHSWVEQKRHQIYCPHDSCGEALTPQECAYFLPAEIFDAWSAIMLEAQISESEKVYCPFPDCSALLLKDETEDMMNTECLFCNRMFCVKCMVPWHADLDCSEFQNTLPGKTSEADLQLFKLVEDRKWQRCGKCKGVIELTFGCNHMTCRCGHEFCYECGMGWANGHATCDCPLANENRLLLQN